jgi:hypothetical protein
LTAVPKSIFVEGRPVNKVASGLLVVLGVVFAVVIVVVLVRLGKSKP